MRKSSTLEQLNEAWHQEKVAKHYRTYNGAGKPDHHRWQETVKAHKKKVSRCRQMKNRAKWVACWLNDLDTWSFVIRNNRKSIGLPPQITTFGNSGQAKLTRDDVAGVKP